MSSKRKTAVKEETEAARPSFEAALERLDEIIDKIEGEQLSLDDMVDCYEEGMKLLFSCRERIQQAKLRVETLEASFESAQLSEDGDTGSAAATADGLSPADRPRADDDDEIRLF